MSASSESPSQLPPVSVFFAVLRMLVQAFIRSRPRKEAEAFLFELGSIVEDEETIHPLFPNREPGERAAQRAAQSDAAAWIRNVLPQWVASLRPRGRR